MITFVKTNDTTMKTMKWMVALAALVLAAVSCGQRKETPKVLVLYYSQSENTRAVADVIALALGADEEEILPVVPYDGSYEETIQRSRLEREGNNLPEIQPLKVDLSAYDVVFLGYPIWYGTYALPVATLLEQIDLSGKKVVPFCTFGSGGLVSSTADLAAKQPGAEILPGYGVRAARIASMPKEVDQFLKANGFLEGDFAQLEAFPEQHAVNEEESSIFDAAVEGYPMIHAKAVSTASRTIPGGVEYLFTAEDLPREGAPERAPSQMKVYVTVEEGQAPVFTQVVR